MWLGIQTKCSAGRTGKGRAEPNKKETSVRLLPSQFLLPSLLPSLLSSFPSPSSNSSYLLRLLQIIFIILSCLLLLTFLQSTSSISSFLSPSIRFYFFFHFLFHLRFYSTYSNFFAPFPARSPHRFFRPRPLLFQSIINVNTKTRLVKQVSFDFFLRIRYLRFRSLYSSQR